MLPKRSIRNQFVFQLFVASAALILIFSTILYTYIRQSIYEEQQNELIQFAQNIIHNQVLDQSYINDNDRLLSLSIEMVTLKETTSQLYFKESIKNQRNQITLYHLYDEHEKNYLKITKDITRIKQMLRKIYNSIIVINLIILVFTIFYVLSVSNILIRPIRLLSRKISGMNENMISPIDISKLPEEFGPLGETINNLLNRLTTFIKYQKELFIGTAHELKTPLAVMKLKNEVTLLKERTSQEYKEALKLNITTINEMNKVISDILNIGRQEGAQFEPPVEDDIIKLLTKRGEDFKLLAKNQNKEVILDLQPESYTATIQFTLFNQIIQNFLQNAVKFTPEGKRIYLKSHTTNNGLTIEIIDEGSGIDESVDFFAPFKRAGNKSGAGLGLFLAKSAADALGAEISLKNRLDSNGTIATLKIKPTLTCILSLQ